MTGRNACRRIHVYCIGPAKTGTTSFASMFEEGYRAAHEPETERTNHLIIRYLDGEVSRDELARELVSRDSRLRLEVEAAHPLGYAADVLAETFPASRFVVTIREPRSWLQSRLSYHLATDPPAWREYRQYFWARRHSSYAPEERVLERNGLYSLDVYLGQYAEQYNRVMDAIPAGRRLVIRTDRLAESIPEVARFVGAQLHGIRAAHRNPARGSDLLLEQLDPAFVGNKIWSHCETLIREQFPETIASYLTVPA